MGTPRLVSLDAMWYRSCDVLSPIVQTGKPEGPFAGGPSVFILDCDFSVMLCFSAWTRPGGRYRRASVRFGAKIGRTETVVRCAFTGVFCEQDWTGAPIGGSGKKDHRPAHLGIFRCRDQRRLGDRKKYVPGNAGEILPVRKARRVSGDNGMATDG